MTLGNTLGNRGVAGVGRAGGALLVLAAAGCSMLQRPLPPGPVAVTLTERTGRVLVVRPPSYVVATPGIALEVGDTVTTLAKASATLSYVLLDRNGVAAGPRCSITVPPNSQLTVTGGGDCGGAAVSTLSEDDGTAAGS